MLDESEKIKVHLNVKRNDRPGTPFVLVLMIYKLNKSNTMLYSIGHDTIAIRVEWENVSARSCIAIISERQDVDLL